MQTNIYSFFVSQQKSLCGASLKCKTKIIGFEVYVIGYRITDVPNFRTMGENIFCVLILSYGLLKCSS